MTRIRPRDDGGPAFHFGFDITIQGAAEVLGVLDQGALGRQRAGRHTPGGLRVEGDVHSIFRVQAFQRQSIYNDK